MGGEARPHLGLRLSSPGWSSSDDTLHAGGAYEALLKFDLSSIPSNATVNSAKLKLHTSSTVSDALLVSRAVLSPWTEATSTFAGVNQQFSSKLLGSMVPSAPNTSYSMKLKTSTVQGWIDGSIANKGLVLETMVSDPPDAEEETLFMSSDASTPELRPELEVCYTAGCIEELSVGYTNAFVRKADGSVWAWGSGVPGVVSGTSPLPMPSLGTDVREISAGRYHTCVLKADGSVWCWGYNTYGGVGDGTTVLKTTPVQVAALGTSVVQISVGNYSSCALKADGSVWCWGYNPVGGIGDGTTVNRLSPVQVTALGTSVTGIEAGVYSSCARTSNGALWCWGNNQLGQLGDGTTVNRLLPVQVTALGTSVIDMSLGQFTTCARTSDGLAWCWGKFSGDGTGQVRHSPVNPALTCP